MIQKILFVGVGVVVGIFITKSGLVPKTLDKLIPAKASTPAVT